MTNPKALKDLYVALGGTAADVDNLDTSVEVLNAISVLLGGEGGALVNPKAIENIAEVASGAGGGAKVTPITVTARDYGSGWSGQTGEFAFASPIEGGGYELITEGSNGIYGVVPVGVSNGNISTAYFPKVTSTGEVMFLIPSGKAVLVAYPINGYENEISVNGSLGEAITLYDANGNVIPRAVLIPTNCETVEFRALD